MLRPFEIRAGIKRHFPHLYQLLFLSLLPVFRLWRAYKSWSFKRRVVHNTSYDGHQFFIVIDPKNGLVDRSIFVGGIYELDIVATINNYLPSGGVFVDIGANIGHHSLFAGAVVGDKGKVLSFEPIGQLADQFDESVAINNFTDRIEIVRQACGDKAGKGTISLKRDNLGGSSLVAGGNEVSTESINICVADEVISTLKRKVDMIKIDTEGYEPEVLLGLLKTIERDRPVVILEYSPILWQNNNHETGINLILQFTTRSYKAYDLDHNQELIAEVTNWVMTTPYNQTNLLFLP
ncbi:hypothetical protein COU87_01075 [Candidatus Roizmanbacteria bacterium CG10_big_fil_rev_8_21_14_0_10_39_12]|uniref:Methyltransferase FkbM domain-containing protein n=1 Tax=Candidatus Roizmanbacteria bacterium CG10_big_fil_rev_8_21_14_0_10_39_12 TaxID=1974852 RepID=A0A2M8KQC0_9BACT|nr:MAG: hypothetical protein COU87_01075 [Candidatus Roizmanbacteria bacterium CG10_big_fil_rev_8_21_14_0_10_39_12]